MNKNIIRIPFLVGILLVFSCHKDNFSIWDSFDEVIAESGVMPFATESYQAEEGEPTTMDIDSVTWTCTNQKIVAGYIGGGSSGFSLFNPNASVVYPGSLLQGKSLKNSTPDIIAVDRAGGVISIDVINGNMLAKVAVEEVSKSAIAQAANDIISNSDSILPANFQFSIEEVQSQQQFAAALKVDYNSAFADISSELSFSSDREYNRFLVRLEQSYYTLSFDIPKDVSDLFSPQVTPQDLAKYVGPGNPATYISDVTYGQIYYMLIESTSSAKEMKAAINASFNGLFASGSIDASTQYVSNLSNLNIKVFGFGGNAKSLLMSLGNANLEQLKVQLAESTDIRAGKPVSYVVRNIYDNSIVSVQLNTEYTVSHCEPYGGPTWAVGWTDIHNKLGPVGAMFSSGDLYDQGKVFFFNQAGDQYCIGTYNGVTGPYPLSAFSAEVTKLIRKEMDLDLQFVGNAFPFSGIGAGIVGGVIKTGPFFSEEEYGALLIDPTGTEYTSVSIDRTTNTWSWSTKENLHVFRIFDFNYLFEKVTAVGGYFGGISPVEIFSFTFFNEGGGIKRYSNISHPPDLDISNTNYKLSTQLIHDFQFFGAEACTQIKVGNKTGTIIVNKAGSRYVYLPLPTFYITEQDIYEISGPYFF